jgi:ABC-type bacteriocin/lantibiotic exporter with double-glycine peptidase domain
MNLTRFYKYVSKYWKLQAIVGFLGLLAGLFALINPYLSKLVIDKAYGNRDLKLFLILAVIGGSVFVFNGILNSYREYLSQKINQRVHFDITNALFKHLQSLPLSFFHDKSTGELIYKISSDVGSASSFVCNAVPELIKLYPRFLITLAIVFYLNWKIGLLMVILIPVSCLQPYFFGRRIREATRRMIEKSEGIFRGLEEVFSHAYLVRALGKEDYETKRFRESLSKEMDLNLKITRLTHISGFSGSLLNKAVSGMVFLYGGYQIIQGTMTLGSLTAIMIYLGQLSALIGSIARFHESVIISSVSRQRLGVILDAQPRIKDKPAAREHIISPGKIEFKNLHFAYKEGEYILKDMSFSIEPGAKIAIVGQSGCGKTTLLALLLRIYEPEKGRILIDGIDIRDIKMECLKQQFAVCLQEPFLWNTTFKDNILYAKENATIEEIIRAGRMAQAHDFIMGLKQGYDTQIGEDACLLSDGQKQRIAIARAVMNKAKILILDEAMSSTDSQTEDKIIDNILQEFRESSVLMVSHRLSAVRKMDLVSFLEGPSYMVCGTHEELLERNLKYRELFASQINKVASMEKYCNTLE